MRCKRCGAELMVVQTSITEYRECPMCGYVPVTEKIRIGVECAISLFLLISLVIVTAAWDETMGRFGL